MPSENEIRELFARIMRDENESLKLRMQAAEILAKKMGYFTGDESKKDEKGLIIKVEYKKAETQETKTQKICESSKIKKTNILI